jgi:hypothetical protein
MLADPARFFCEITGLGLRNHLHRFNAHFGLVKPILHVGGDSQDSHIPKPTSKHEIRIILLLKSLFGVDQFHMFVSYFFLNFHVCCFSWFNLHFRSLYKPLFSSLDRNVCCLKL